MRRLLANIFSFIGLGLSILVALAFTFVEFRSLFAGDFSLFNIPAVGFFHYFFRGLFFLSVVAISIIIIVFIAKGKERYITLFLICSGIFIASFVTLVFYIYYIALVIIVISFIPLIITFLKLKRN